MPELPEVEAARRRVEAAARGKRIVALTVHHPSFVRRLDPRRRRLVRGARIERVERRGKHQLFWLSNGYVIHVHFRMTGDWAIGNTGDTPEQYRRAAIELEDRTVLALVDPRALSTITVHNGARLPLPALGPEPLDEAFAAATLATAFARRRGPVKPALLDQQVVVGIGNIYASEALWVARIDPRTSAARLGTTRLERLVQAIRDVLTDAVVGAVRDEPESTFAVYDREDEPCRRCGAPIRRIVQSGRSTYYCPGCQRR